MITLLRRRRTRKQTVEALAFIESITPTGVPVMPSRHLPTTWWVKP